MRVDGAALGGQIAGLEAVEHGENRIHSPLDEAPDDG